MFRRTCGEFLLVECALQQSLLVALPGAFAEATLQGAGNGRGLNTNKVYFCASAHLFIGCLRVICAEEASGG